jgi:general secretion pathway protein C
MNNQASALLTRLPQLQTLNRWLPTIVSLMLVIACAHALVKISWMFLPETETDAIPTHATSVNVTTAHESTQDIRRLTGAHLFGETQRAAATAQTNVPETRLNLVLRGVVAADPMATSSAIIAQGNGGKEDVYGIGDKLPGGVSVSKVYSEQVILERGGRFETLNLAKDSDVGEIVTDDGDLPTDSPGEALREIRSNILKNPTSFGEYALPVVVKQGGKQIGYRLEPQKKGDMLTQMGLEPQDVITEINGVKLDNPQNGIIALRKLSTSNSINIKVRRNGTEVPLNIQLQ